MADVFTANVYTRNPETGENELFKIGDEVPEWAYDHMGAHVFSQGVVSPEESAPRSDSGVDPAAFTADVADAEGPFKSEAPTVEQVEEVPADEDEDEDEEVDYADLTKDELKAEAKARELSGYSSLSKEELIALLEEDDAANAEADEVDA